MNTKKPAQALCLDFEKLKKVAAIEASVIPVVIQEKGTNIVLTLAYVNEAALKKSLETGYVVLWSTSRNEYWEKGASSGNRLRLESVNLNCKANSLLFTVSLEGEGACHVKQANGCAYHSCFFRPLNKSYLNNYGG